MNKSGVSRARAYKIGPGEGTRSFFDIYYAPPGDSPMPALAVSHDPGVALDENIPTVFILSTENVVGPSLQVKRVIDGNLISLQSGGNIVLVVNQDGDLDAEGYIYAQLAVSGGVSAVEDGNTDVDMTSANVFTCTPTENTVFTTTSPTNGLGGQFAVFQINNAAGVTVSWSTGFTSITGVYAGQTGITSRLMYFDGSTWRELSTGTSSGGGIPYGQAYPLDFKMVDDNNPALPLTGLTISFTTSKDGSAFNALTGTPAVSELGFGWYTVEIPAADTSCTRGIWRATATGAAQYDRQFMTS